MNDSQRNDPQHHHPEHSETHTVPVELVLSALREASPAPGFEARLLQRLESRPKRTLRPWHRWPRLAVISTALAVSGVCTFALLQHRAHTPKGETSYLQQHTGRQQHASSPLEPSPDVSFRPEQARSLRLRSGETRMVVREARTPAASANASTSHSLSPSTAIQQQASFPAPEMPLTEEERLLIQIAHRNDPVQVALLDPVKRDLALTRERAEVKQFFMPRQLPPELQQEIDAVVRAQYELPQPAPSRSLP